MRKSFKKIPKMKTKKLFYLLAFAIALLAMFFGCSCDREEPDVVAPSAPSGLTVIATTINSISISWSPSSDNVEVIGYKIYRDGVFFGTVFETSFTDKNLVPNSFYVYTISAFDRAGNVSKFSEPLKAKTEDDCPTCSKWMTEITLTPPATLGTIGVGQSKSAGTLFVKNVSSSSHTANLTLSFPDLVAPAIDSLSYTLNGEVVKQKLSNNSVTLNQISVPANSTAEIKLSYKIKEVIPAGIADGSQISLALTATTTDESGVIEPGNRIFPSVNLDKLKVLTAQIDASKSYEASARAEDKVLFGNSVAKAFVLEVVTPGTVRLEVIGKMNDQSSAIKYFWINSKDDEDFYTSVSTLNPIHPKTSFGSTGSIEINLKAGTNVIAFKTNPYSGKIGNNSKVGLRVVGNDFVLENGSYTANSLADNLAAKVKVQARVNVGLYLSPQSAAYNSRWCRYFIYPQNDDGSYDASGYPKIAGLSLSTEYWAKKYPKLYFAPSPETPSEFEASFTILGALFGENVDPNNSYFGTVFAKDLVNNIVKYENNIISFSGTPQQTADVNKYSVIAIMLNAYNADTEYFRPGYVTFDPHPKGWKFVGNPEIELWTEGEVTTAKRIQ